MRLLTHKFAIFKLNKRLLVSASFFTSLLSCNKEEVEVRVPTEKDKEPISIAAFENVLSSPKLLYEETFEGNGPFFYNGFIQSGTSYGFTVSTNVVYQGKKSGRFELRSSDPSTSGGTRVEVKYPPLTNSNRWYSFAVYFPSPYYKYDSEAEIISQWHQGKGVSPSMSLLTKHDKLYLEIRTDPDEKNLVMLGNVSKDRWQTFVFHIIHSRGSNGLIEVWRNGLKILTRKGGNAYSFYSYEKPKWKLGLYKWEWNGNKTTDTNKRIIFFDNIRVGSENATYRDMVVAVPKSLIPSAVIKSFTLVNAETEKDIMTITNGATIQLSKLQASKFNIRAMPNLNVGSVKFVLSGRQNKIYKDDKAPYALNGDNEKGNYFFGSWDPPPTGDYMLQATPFSDDNAEGLTGTTATIKFRVIK